MLKSLDTKRDLFYLINKYSKIISQIEIEILLSYILNCTRPKLYINNISMDETIEDLLDSLIERRLCGEPIQYITGSSEFMGWDFIINKDVFIPRPETEILANEVLAKQALQLPHSCSCKARFPNLQILDLCTGCGNIAISLVRLMGNVEIIATDISEPALGVAQENSILHKVDKNIRFYKGDLFNAVPFDKKYKFDIIVCNPPYIKSTELEFLQKEVNYEPEISLCGGEDGLEFYRRIEKNAPHYLKKDGSLFLEVGFGQAQAVKDIFASKKIFEVREVKRDFAGIERVISLCYNHCESGGC